jgi:arginyl-tRNA synthetase
MNLLHLLQERFRGALTGLVPDPTPYSSLVKPSQDAKFGDYQFNGAMSLAKVLGKKPRDIAQEIVQRLPKDDLFEHVEIAGPGFINVRLSTDWLARELQRTAKGDRLGVEPAQIKRTFVIDYSSPNVAKPMHVGHLRSTIIGDSLARLLRFLGHKVIADNHLGDWGTQFGMLLYGYKHFLDEKALADDPVREMARLYVQVRKLIDPIEKTEEAAKKARQKARKANKDKPLQPEALEALPQYTEEELSKAREVREAARQETAKLHAGDPKNLQLWQKFMPWCLAEIEHIYLRLDVKFDKALGESFYNPMLPGLVQELLQAGLAQESQGAVIIPTAAGDDDSDGDEPPSLIRKSDGAFTYTTTDLATIRYRMDEWRPNALLYVVGIPQALHFSSLFDAARRWGFEQVEFQHVGFGAVLGPDRKMFGTRKGDPVHLEDLLDQAINHAKQTYEKLCKERMERGQEVPQLSTEELQQVHEAVGYGAVKYADLSQNRESDYVFSWEKMLTTEGNTATYMQYAYARCRSIFRKGDENADLYRTHPPAVYLQQPQERALALELLRFEETLMAAAADYRPNIITAYLWDLAKTYSGFNDACPVLKADTPALRQSRLLICDLTARTIQKGLDLLGIRTIERM